MAPTAIQSGIRFGDLVFSEPTLLPDTCLAGIFDQPGLYVVLVHDSNWQPRPFRPLYFGESDGVWQRATGAHENCDSWRARGGLFEPVYRALCPLPGWTRVQRQLAESALISAYQPPCNDRLSRSLGALTGVARLG